MKKITSLLLCMVLMLSLMATGVAPEVSPSASPAAEVTTPVTQEPAAPSQEPAAPSQEPAAPSQEPAAPSQEPAAPSQEPAAPSQEPAAPSQEPAAPSQEPAAPTQAPELSFAQRVDRCQNMAEIFALLDGLTDAEKQVLTQADEDYLNAKVKALEDAQNARNEAAPAEQEPSEPPVESEIFIPSANVTDVAPFLPAVSGAATFALPFARPAEETDNGLEVSKSATVNDNGTYTITLEAYATGDKVITDISKQVPTDIVLVLDQSGSMKDALGKSDRYERYNGDERENANLYNHRLNNNRGDKNLYYKLDDGTYVQVNVERKNVNVGGKYTQFGNERTTNEEYYDKANGWLGSGGEQLYVKIDGEFQEVTISWKSDSFLSRKGTYTYKVGDAVIATSKNDKDDPTFALEGHTVEQVLYTHSRGQQDYEYTYSYKLSGQDSVIIGKSVGERTEFTAADLYRHETGTISRHTALVNALNSFVSSVEKKAVGDPNTTDDDVNHRIAVVGFGSGKEYDFENTELLIGSREYNYNTLGMSGSKRSNNAEYLESAFQDMDQEAGRKNVRDSIGKLATEGATKADHGVEMAEAVLDANPVPAGEERNRVVIVFTDGAPTNQSGFVLRVANSAIKYAGNIKASGATVYSVGVFPGADATKAGNKPSSDLDQDRNLTNACNWFMQNLSSNNGVVQTPSYYLSANNATDLDDIFKNIAGQIETGGSTTKLDSSAVIRDVIAPSFQLPAGTAASDIRLETYSYSADGQWTPNGDPMGAVASVNGDQISVTGFDFAEHYVGTVTTDNSVSYRGDKLVISFDVVTKDGFLGGNNVPTNTIAGLYENAWTEKAVELFPVPEVNVPIRDLTVSARDFNVYAMTGITVSDMRSGVTASAGNVQLKPTEENFGLEPWQNAYVNIDFRTADSDLADLLDDTEYTAGLTVSPKTDGLGAKGAAAQTKTGEAVGNIHVFLPSISFYDSALNLGETPVYMEQNFGDENWEHGNQYLDDSTEMYTERPEITYTFSPEAAPLTAELEVYVEQMLLNGKAIPADHVFFFRGARDTCPESCDMYGKVYPYQVGPDEPNFKVHVKSFDLVISKTVANNPNPDQLFVFDVRDAAGKLVTQVVLKAGEYKTISGLSVGSYTVTENTEWSWRYEAQQPSITVSANSVVNGIARADFINSPKTDKWLSFETNILNEFGEAVKPDVK